MDTITRKDAIAKGLKNYFTGIPCKNGHTDLRYVCNHKCVTCTAEQTAVWTKSNPEKVKAVNLKWRESRRDKQTVYNKAYYKSNLEKDKLRKKEYRNLYPEKAIARNAVRRALKLNATPFWSDLSLVQIFYKDAQLRTKTTLVPHSVDHIVPLSNPYVCGLHNQFNLQVITISENSSKGNRYWPDMSEITPELKKLANDFYEAHTNYGF